jgi:serine/threonine protein kinase
MDRPVDRPQNGPPAAEETTSRYEVLTRIASGGMATVFVGRARGAAGFSRLVAIKRAHPSITDDATVRDSFEREARVAAAIHHPHVVSVLDVELHGQNVSLILDYVEGCTLAELLKHANRNGDRLSLRVALRVLLDVASGLHAAHVLCDTAGRPLGIVHRDVSPQNVLVGLDGHARLTDFGIAKITNDLQQTATNSIKGKLGYLAPEYVETQAFDARSDEYALGVVAWEALAGNRLFHGPNEMETFRRILDGQAPLLSEIRPELLPFDAIVARALARDPARRFDSVSDFARALEECGRREESVGLHEEVAAAVHAVAGARLQERRQVIESSTPQRLSDFESVRVRSARDSIATRTLAGATLEPSPQPVPNTPNSLAASHLDTISDPVQKAEPPSGSSRWPLLLAAGACLLLFGLTAIGIRHWRAPAPEAEIVGSVPPAADPPTATPPSETTAPNGAEATPRPDAVAASPSPPAAPVASPTLPAPSSHPAPVRPAPRPRPAPSSRPKSSVLFHDPG